MHMHLVIGECHGSSEMSAKRGNLKSCHTDTSQTRRDLFSLIVVWKSGTFKIAPPELWNEASILNLVEGNSETIIRRVELQTGIS